MDNFLKGTKLGNKLLVVILVVIAAIFAADVLYINQFNSRVHTSVGYAEGDATNLYIDTRDDNTSTWVKRDFELDGETVDLNAQTFEATLTNSSDYEVADWSFTLQIAGDCFLNNAWCGTVEIHQHAGTDDEKVQTLDLRSCDTDSITLDYLYDGDLLIPLYAGDYIVYHPSVTESDNELPVAENGKVSMGFILYFLDEPDLTGYTLVYQYHRSYTDCALFAAGAVIGILWLFMVDAFIFSLITYRVAKREMESKKSGVSAMSDIYSIIYIIDLAKNELIPVVADKESERLRPKDLNAQDQLRGLFEWDSTEVYREAVVSFCDLGTVVDRLGDRNTLVCEYKSRIHGWCRLRFFVMDRNAAGSPIRLIFAIQIINEEKEELEALNAEVEAKTENIIDIQQKVVVGLANIIENRDNNTGGHVKRTSEVIRIIVDEIERQGRIPIGFELAGDIVRAAPMHDLGKISIDSSILCKPGRLTDEEYAVMKTHSTKSGEMVKILLDGVEEEHFVHVAYNIARHHHERWNGHGYPDGLAGDDIPLEARIMAIADVYDALVSKRCYKEPMSYEQAYEIMIEGMGSQFDPKLKEVFCGCSKKLEAYYRRDR